MYEVLDLSKDTLFANKSIFALFLMGRHSLLKGDSILNGMFLFPTAHR
jgi:hypothetical protein